MVRYRHDGSASRGERQGERYRPCNVAGMDGVVSIETRKSYLKSRITPRLEQWLHFLLTKVRPAHDCLPLPPPPPSPAECMSRALVCYIGNVASGHGVMSTAMKLSRVWLVRVQASARHEMYYLTWLNKRYFAHPETAETLIPDVIRFICWCAWPRSAALSPAAKP
jgi:hypothetical protein